jgi:erythromycin esterase
MLRLRHAFVLLLHLGFSLLVISCKKAEPDPLADLSADKLSVVQAFNKVILPLQDAEPTRDFTEFTPLDTVLAKAQVVGMGEGTHGTREFFRMKDRLFRYLVQKHGHQTIAFEANFGRAVLVNRFIHGQNSQSTGLASAALAAKSMYFWTWSTDEVRELLQWMKDYNTGKSANQQLSFYGFDCQYADDEFPLLTEFLANVAPASVAKVDSLASQYALVSKLATTDPLRQQYAQGLIVLHNLFVANESKWVAAAGSTEYEIARQAARVLIQQQDLGDASTCNSGAKRDQYMAENVQWLLTRMNVDKVSLWAHNYHMANMPAASCNLPTMGAYLKKQLTTKYLIVGQLLTNGSFTAVDGSQGIGRLKSLSIRTEGVNNSFNYLLGKGQYTNFALNLHQTQLGSVLTDWLSAKHPLFEAGAVFDETRPEQYYTITALTGRFDLLIHFRDTTPTQLLP